MAEYLGQGFSRHSQYCRTNKLAQLSDEYLHLEDPWQQFTALQNEHAQSLVRAPQAFRNAPILKMNVTMA
jgi:hypothetical protein